ncbi:MarR family winged helix-turn-helix transcriptional regulator [Actinomadura rupiterrae]|uniref:MarR family winged helix-turn-helix transcriptional regulator n=1 Tax=Actinomadura rupiterrae TaxID=559627 RepID=UPI0020A390E1|nr:MarR family transcriptional regulator [Actinomadura rupiterrae]MCP2338457.1 DNA-binding MarR family transcriptional regulator [Actinomadura rupiterrae]
MPEFLDLHGRTSKAVRAVADAAVRRHGLHLGQDHLLAVLWREDGRTPGEAAAALNVTTANVVKAANRMEAAGLLTRRRDPKDNRLVRLWLTDIGRALQQPIEKERRHIEDQLTAALTPAERTTLLTALEKIHTTATALLNAQNPPSS